MFKFEIIHQSKKSLARIGKITTPHGEILTPAFLPVATLGIIKGGVQPEEVLEIGVQCQIINTFHFFDLGWVKIVKKFKGIHQFLNFPKPIFSDSGGFQVLSLGKGLEYGIGKISSFFPGKNTPAVQRKEGLVKITEEGVRFKSPRDGRELFLTPEKVIEIQKDLKTDFIYLLDICDTPFDDYQTVKRNLTRTFRWFNRALKIKIPSWQERFAIIQGGLFKDLREKSVDFVNSLDVFGIAIGGALGKEKKDMYKIINWINKKIDFQRPHHLLGIGDLDSLEKIISLGIDLFDCTEPTKLARHGFALTKKGRLDIRKHKWKNKSEKLVKNCQCPTCQRWSVAQLHYLYKAKEMLLAKLLTIHNLYLIEQKLKEIRQKIALNKL